jgi:hypothetical protein
VAAADPLHDHVVGHVDEDRGRELAPALVERVGERVGLRDRAREPVQHDRLAVQAVQRVADRLHDHLVRHEVAAVHVLRRAAPEVGALGVRLAEQFARRQDRVAEPFAQPLGLHALAAARRSEQHDGRLHGDIIDDAARARRSRARARRLLP